MAVWAVTMVKDELDILPYTLAHLAGEGVEGIIVADNLSTDGTWEWLRDGPALDCVLVTRRDNEVGYYQSDKMTALVHEAFSYGADWVIPFDADELWFNRSATLHETLAAHTQTSGVLQVAFHNYFPTSLDAANEPNPFRRITRRDPDVAELRKVIVHAHPSVTVTQGNHEAIGPEPFPRCGTPITMAHFPWRSPEQFVRKVRNGAAAYRATDLALGMGAHWRQYGAMLDEHGPESVVEHYQTWFFDPDKTLIDDPVPWNGPKPQ